MNEMIKGRLAALRQEMEKEGIDYYMIPTSDFHSSEYVNDYFKAREYFSGFTGSNGTLVVGKEMAGLWTDGRYFIQAQKELEGTGITLFRMQEEGVPDIPDFLCEKMEEGQTLGFDGRTVSCMEGRKLEKKLKKKQEKEQEKKQEKEQKKKQEKEQKKKQEKEQEKKQKKEQEKKQKKEQEKKQKKEQKKKQEKKLKKKSDEKSEKKTDNKFCAENKTNNKFRAEDKTDRKHKIVIKYDADLAGRVWTERPKLPSHPVRMLPEEISGKSTLDKLKAVREKIAEAGAEYLLLSKLDDLMWLLNIRGNDVECNPVALSYGFITPQEMYFFIQQSEVTEEFKEYAAANRIILKPYEEITDFLKQFPYDSGEGTGKALLDEANANYALYKILTKRTKHVAGDNPTERLKAVKNETEFARIKEVYRKDSAALIKFIYWLKQNVGKQEITEISAAEYLDNLRRNIDGFVELSFPTISAYKENAAMMHYEAAADNYKTLAPEGMYLVDSGGQYMGGTTDVTRTVVLGEITDEMKMHFTLTAVGMLQLTDAKFLYGCTGRNLDILARQPLWNRNIDYKCGTGHGIGYILNVHEGPQNIRWRLTPEIKEAVLEAGMIVSNEPGVYREGSHGIRTENILVVQNGEKNEDGQFMHFATLTYVPIDREAIDTRYMQPADIERLNRYHAAVYEKTSEYLTEEEREWLAEVTAPL